MLWELFHRKTPYDGLDVMKVAMEVGKGRRPDICDSCPQEMQRKSSPFLPFSLALSFHDSLLMCSSNRTNTSVLAARSSPTPFNARGCGRLETAFFDESSAGPRSSLSRTCASSCWPSLPHKNCNLHFHILLLFGFVLTFII